MGFLEKSGRHIPHKNIVRIILKNNGHSLDERGKTGKN